MVLWSYDEPNLILFFFSDNSTLNSATVVQQFSTYWVALTSEELTSGLVPTGKLEIDCYQCISVLALWSCQDICIITHASIILNISKQLEWYLTFVTISQEMVSKQIKNVLTCITAFFAVFIT